MVDDHNANGTYIYRYEDILRAVGRFIDEEGIQDVVVLQVNDGIRVQGYRTAGPRDAVNPQLVERTFTSEEIATLDAEARKRRGTGSLLFG